MTVPHVIRLTLLLVLFSPMVAIEWPPPAPTLSTTTTHHVTVHSVSELEAAIGALQSDTTIRLAAGTYRLNDTLIIDGVSNVAIRGDTGDPADVRILGRGMRDSGIGNCFTVRTVDGILFADCTIGDCFWHPIQLKGELGCVRPHLYNLILLDAGEQHLKGSDDEARNGCSEGLVEYCTFRYTTSARQSYIGGIDIHAGHDWVIRDCRFEGIQAPTDELAGPAILMWSESSGTIVERCVFIDCSRSIVLGLEDKSGSGLGFHDHTGGIVRNNFIYRGPGAHNGADVGIYIGDSPDTLVVHNTVQLSGSYANAIEVRFPGSRGGTLANNCCDADIRTRNGGAATFKDNRADAQPSWFAAAGLPGPVPEAPIVDAGTAIMTAPTDFYRSRRPAGSGADLGCVEHAATAANRRIRITIDPPDTAPAIDPPHAASSQEGDSHWFEGLDPSTPYRLYWPRGING